MKIEIIAEHSVCLELLLERANILDAGCRGFEFTNYFRERGHKVLAIDIDEELEGNYVKCGIATFTGAACVKNNIDPQAKRIYGGIETNFLQPHLRNGMIRVFTLKYLQANFCKDSIFDLIKLDIEGEEVDILKTAIHPIAKQISVEFHAHCTDQTKESLDALLIWLSQWYTIYNQFWESRHGAGFSYWDVLLIQK